MSSIGLILAAGASTRMGHPKALVKTGEKTLLERVYIPYSEAGIPVMVVIGFHAPEVERHAHHLGLVCIRNPAPWRGMISSVRTGLHAMPRHVDHVFIHPVDCPGVSARTLLCLEASLSAFPLAGGAKPTYCQRGGHPLLLSRRTWQRILSKRQNNLKSAVSVSTHCLLRIESYDAAVLNDLDTPAAVTGWNPAERIG